MVKEIKEIQDFLEQDPRRTITIYNNETEEKIVRKICLPQILESAENLEEYIKNLKHSNVNLEEIAIDKYTSNGTSDRKRGLTVRLTTTSNNDLPMGGKEMGALATMPGIVALPVSNHGHQVHTPQIHSNPTMSFGLNGGLSIPQQISLFTKAERYDELKEQITDLKGEYRELKTENASLVLELRQKDALLATSDKKLEYEMLKKDLEKKPMIDSKILEKGLDTITAIVPSMVQSKVETGGLTGAEDHFSEEKTRLLNAIRKPNCDDAICNNLALIYSKLRTNPKFVEELKILIEKY